MFLFLNIKFEFITGFALIICLIVAIGFDLITGVTKARIRGELATSFGYRKTIIKVAQYLGTFAIVLFIRLMILAMQEHFKIKSDMYGNMKYLDYATHAVLIFSIFIEFTSALENLSEIDKKSPFSRYIIQPLLRLLTFQLKNNPFKRAADATKLPEAQ